ncbi:class I SAM-dependent methyltransferase [Planomonospora parontospora]|uniref:class I SAM-dependent methyltransferase n=1 Tax=Planomonospora parontospora TaxID=58119 RepID=UPI00166FBF6E|nr:class I SAM-dependent methyltransferase [Planomonospora parontospora]GGL25682.1 SAM-dependent methyltransferase [Planomonospora parontospora subsp. antibiotica]GII20221.1 SAM-dependent methyltransferase [Planomonospora parontospora subsp. antibiotica]
MEEARSRWAEIAGEDAGERYAARFAELAASGADVHGEARLCAALAPPGSRVLDAGCGTGRVAIRLAELGYACAGVDLDESMLAVARSRAPGLTWVRGDLSTLDPGAFGPDVSRPGAPGRDASGPHASAPGAALPDASGPGRPFDLVVAAGNVIPLLAPGTEARAVRRLAALLRPGGLLVAGFGLDAAHLPLASATVGLTEYDAWCEAAGLVLERRMATWDGDPYDGGGYAVSVHRRIPDGTSSE